MTENKLNELATQVVSQLKIMDDFKGMHKLMLQKFITIIRAVLVSQSLYR